MRGEFDLRELPLRGEYIELTDYRRWYRLFNPSIVGVLTCEDNSKESGYNLIPLIWIFPLSANPPYIAVSISRKRYTHRLLLNTCKFTISILSPKSEELVKKLGSVSGAHVDKVREYNISLETGANIDVPHLREAIAWIEVERTEIILRDNWDHDLFIGRVVGAFARAELYDRENLYWKRELPPEFKPLFWLAQDIYTTYQEPRPEF